jgi:hypothetical protein
VGVEMTGEEEMNKEAGMDGWIKINWEKEMKGRRRR